jgi:hypothetical protein
MTTYTATTPDGTNTATRNSNRAYTHASWVEIPLQDGTTAQRITGFHMSEASAHKTYGGQAGWQVREYKSLPHGVVTLTVDGPVIA